MLTVLAIAAGSLVGSAIAQSSSTAPASSAPPPASSAQPAPTQAPPPTAAGPAPAGDTVLTDKHYTWPNVPYQVDTDPTGRGPQSGYNICNSTTAGPTSNCQTAFINNIDDWCLWGPTVPNSLVGDVEAASVAWCTTAAHGTRVMPAGTITALQFLKAPGYLQVTGLINQAGIDMDPTDSGGELDPHGADERGNPLGGLMFSNGFPSSAGNPNDIQQVIQWHSFMGSGQFCLKACDPNVANSAQYCDNIYDRIGCAYNAPAAYQPNVFETCLSDNQDPPGVYTGTDGVVTTYHQPGENTPINSLPYTARIPASSSCTTFSSAAIFTAAPAASTTASSAGAGAGLVTSGAPKPTSAAAAATKSAAGTTNGAGAHVEGVKLGGAIVVALGALVGAVMVL
jgi:hypothetical protein